MSAGRGRRAAIAPHAIVANQAALRAFVGSFRGAFPRLFLILALACAACFSSPARAQTDLSEAAYFEQALASCGADQACQAQVRKLQTRAADKRRQEADDHALKTSNPGSYYLLLLRRFLLFALFVGVAAGGYVLVMHLLFKKKK